MNRLWFYLTSNWQAGLAAGIAGLFVIGLLFFQIGSLTPGASQSELNVQHQNTSFNKIIDNPLNAPFYVLRNLNQKFHHQSIISARKLTALLALLIILTFYLLLKYWFGLRVAVLGTIMIASSSWFLHTGRLASPDILQSFVIVPLMASTWLYRTKWRKAALALLALSSGLMFYIPGLVWFLIAAVAWRAGPFFLQIRKLSKWYMVGCGLGLLVIIAPLIRALIQSPKIALSIFGLPGRFDYLSVINNLWHLPLNIFLRSNLSPQISIAHLPLLDIFSTTMAVLGLYACIKNISLDRSKILIAMLAMSMVLVSLGGPVSLALLLPLIYSFVAIGLSYMLEDWFRVFPRNPLAGNIGASLITVAVLLTVFYHINNYFIAWPNATRTKIEFSKRL